MHNMRLKAKDISIRYFFPQHLILVIPSIAPSNNAESKSSAECRALGVFFPFGFTIVSSYTILSLITIGVVSLRFA